MYSNLKVPDECKYASIDALKKVTQSNQQRTMHLMIYKWYNGQKKEVNLLSVYWIGEAWRTSHPRSNDLGLFAEK